MTDLNTKFTTLETQLAEQHLAIGNALSSILAAMGAPPPTAVITLADIATQLTALNNNLIGIAIANGTFHSQLLALVGQMNVNTDTLINNSSLNTQRLLAAILATACACPTETPFLESPLDVTPTDLVGEAKCRRIQFYLAIFGAMVDGIANYGGAGAMVTAAAITEIMYAAALTGGLIGAEVGVVAGPPGIALGAIVGIIGAAIGALGSSYLFTLSAQWHTAPLYDQLLAALYAANSADEGTEAFYAVINASEVLNLPFKPLLNALWWNDWSNEIYGTLPIVDDSAFDGTICAPAIDEDCVIIGSVFTAWNQWETDWTGTGVSTKAESGDGLRMGAAQQFDGWIITGITGADNVSGWIEHESGTGEFYGPGVSNILEVGHALGFVPTVAWFELFNTTSAFTVILCPPEPL